MPDFDAPGRYLLANYEPEDWLAVVLIYRNPTVVKQEFATAEKVATPRYQAHLRAANANGADIYLTVNSLTPGTKRRKKADVETIRHVFLDLDGGGTEAVNRILTAEGMPNPHHVLNTSPGKHQILWRVQRFEKDQAESLVHSMATKFDADQAVWDVARVLRMPGFRNHKYEELRHFVREVHENPTVTAYGPEDFPRFSVDKRVELSPIHTQIQPKIFKGNSQSERDWAYVMRELRRGVDPEVLRSHLERSRRDKSDPRYYAQRTIARAIKEYARTRRLCVK